MSSRQHTHTVGRAEVVEMATIYHSQPPNLVISGVPPFGSFVMFRAI